MLIFQADVVIRRGRPPEIGPYFGVFHWLAVTTLIMVLLGRVAARFQARGFFAYAHPVLMIASYWLLVGGAINEAFARLDWLQQLARAISPTATQLREYELLYWSHYVNNAVMLIALVMSQVGTRRFRRPAPGVVSA